MSDTQNTSNPIQRPPLGFYKAFPGRGVRASVFQNQNSQTGRHYSTVTYTRSYQDENGEWQNSTTLRGWEQSQMSLLVHEASKLQNELDRINLAVDRELGLNYDKQQAYQNTQVHVQTENSAAPAQAPKSPQPQAQPATGLSAQRDTAMANRPSPQKTNNLDTRDQQPVQEP